MKDVIVESQLGTSRFAYLDDHCIQGLKVVPLTAQVELILAATRAAWPGVPTFCKISNFASRCCLSAEECAVQVVLTPGEEGGASFQLISVAALQVRRNSWKVHASGRVERKTDGVPVGGKGARSRNRQASLPEEVSVAEYYERLWQCGLQFGPSFRGIEKLWQSERRVAWSDTSAGRIGAGTRSL